MVPEKMTLMTQMPDDVIIHFSEDSDLKNNHERTTRHALGPMVGITGGTILKNPGTFTEFGKMA
jgi:hypothetical protein